MNKDYSNDVSNTGDPTKITESIDRLRAPIKLMGKDNQEKTMKYIQNLTKLAAIYSNF